MIIEKILIEYLETVVEVPTYAEVPLKSKAPFLIVQKTAGSSVNKINNSTVAIQSYGEDLLKAAELNELVLNAMEELPDHRDEVAKVSLNSNYNFTNTNTEQRRYQAVFDITHY